MKVAYNYWGTSTWYTVRKPSYLILHTLTVLYEVGGMNGRTEGVLFTRSSTEPHTSTSLYEEKAVGTFALRGERIRAIVRVRKQKCKIMWTVVSPSF